jgi:hypothetical protein
MRADKTAVFTCRSWIRSWVVSARLWTKAAFLSDKEASKVLVCAGRDGMVLCRNEGLVVALSNLDNSVAREIRLAETAAESCGRRVWSEVNGGFDRRRLRDSASRDVMGDRRGGRRVRRSRSSGGREETDGGG